MEQLSLLNLDFSTLFYLFECAYLYVPKLKQAAGAGNDTAADAATVDVESTADST